MRRVLAAAAAVTFLGLGSASATHCTTDPPWISGPVQTVKDFVEDCLHP